MWFKVPERTVRIVVGTALSTITEQIESFCSMTGAIDWQPVCFRNYIAVKWDGNVPELPIQDDGAGGYLYKKPEPSFMEVWDGGLW